MIPSLQNLSSYFFIGCFTKILISFSCLAANIYMGIITSYYLGERELAWKIKIAAENLGWKVFLDEFQGTQIKDEQLDFAISLIADNHLLNTSYPKYLAVLHPFNFVNKRRYFNPFCEQYDGFLLTINDRKSLQQGLRRKKKLFHFIPFYPSVYSTSYDEIPLKSLVVMVPAWGNRLTSPHFKTLYQLLSTSDFAKFYGISPHPEFLINHYMGSIPFDGVSVINVLKQNGISLVFHSDIHNNEQIPSARIFEAAAASTVIISDENAFVKKHFGDSVFYIDTSLPGEEIFQQIQNHISTISLYPEQAHAMAKQAHHIFLENFTMEKQLLQLEELHRKVAGIID